MKAGKVQIIAIGGGKGGVGKSVVSANLAICLAQMGKRTIAVDCDLGGANLHTLFGLKTTDRGVGDFLYSPQSKDLSDFAIQTEVPNLWFISGNGFIPGIANLEYQRKIRLLRGLTRLEYDYAILDLGAGTSYNVIDFFSMTQSAVIVTLPEPTAVLNAYEFLKNAIFRILTRRFSRNAAVNGVINGFKTAPDKGRGDTIGTLVELVAEVDAAAGDEIRRVAASFRPALIINMSQTQNPLLGDSLVGICRNYLTVDLQYLGAVPFDEAVQKSSLRMKPFVIEWPDAAPSKAIRAIAHTCLSTDWMDHSLVQEAEPKGEEARAGGGEAGGAVNLQGLLEGHRDSDLSSLLATFLTTSSTMVRSDIARDKHGTPSAAEPPVEAEAVEEDAVLSVDLLIEPRLPRDARMPYFVPVTEADAAPQAPHGLVAFLSRKQRFEWQIVRVLAGIRKNPRIENVGVTLKLLTSNAPHTPRVGWEWLKTGLAFVQIQQIGSAKQAFSCAMVCLPGNDVAVNNWVASQILAETTESLLTVLANEVNNKPDSGYLRYNLGLIQMALRQEGMAADSFGRALALLGEKAPEHTAFLQAYCAYQNTKHQVAYKQFSQIAEKGGDDAPPARYNAALCLLQMGMDAQAIEELTRIVNGSPNDSEAFAVRGLAAWRAHQIEEAISDFTRAIYLDPSNLALRQARGTVCYHAGRLDLAIKDIQTISQLVPSNEAFQHLLLKIRRELE